MPSKLASLASNERLVHPQRGGMKSSFDNSHNPGFEGATNSSAPFIRVGNAPRVVLRNGNPRRSTRGALPTRLNDEASLWASDGIAQPIFSAFKNSKTGLSANGGITKLPRPTRLDVGNCRP